MLLLLPEKQRQGVVHVFLYSLEIMIATVLLVENVVIRGERIISGEHFIRHHQGLALDRVSCTHSVIDKVAALIQIVFPDKLLDEVHVPLDLEIAVGA